MKNLVSIIKTKKALNYERIDRSICNYSFVLASRPLYLAALKELLNEKESPTMDKHFQNLLKDYHFVRSEESFKNILNEFLRNSTIDFEEWYTDELNVPDAIGIIADKFFHNAKWNFEKIRVKGDELLLEFLKSTYNACVDRLKNSGIKFITQEDLDILCCKSRTLLWAQIDKVMSDDDVAALERKGMDRYGYDGMFTRITGIDKSTLPSFSNFDEEITELPIHLWFTPKELELVDTLYQKYKE